MKNVLGPVIKNIRKEKGLTQLELSKLTGFNQNTISNHENQNRSIGEREIAIYAAALNVSPQQLFDSVSPISNSDFLNLQRTYEKLTDSRKMNVINFAEEQLSKQNISNISHLNNSVDEEDNYGNSMIAEDNIPYESDSSREKNLEVLAAHIDENTTEDEMDEITAFIDSLRDED